MKLKHKILKRKILSYVEKDLKAVEEELKKNLVPEFDSVMKVAEHLIFSGGKRLRPLLAILSARLCGYRGDYEITFAVVFEYLHAATLLHDDVIDEASVRRGKVAANLAWDAPTAILTGDFLLGKSLTLAAATGNPKVFSMLARVTERMSAGEIEQLARKGDSTLSESEYDRIIQCKTAALMEGACAGGAILANALPEKEAALGEYGRNLGMAFQMIDDLLDFVSDKSVTGKKTGADLREGKLTLPLIHALKQADAGDRGFMESLIRRKSFNREEFSKLNDLLNRYHSIEYTEKRAAAHVKCAKQSLENFVDSDIKNVLCMMADYAALRKS